MNRLKGWRTFALCVLAILTGYLADQSILTPHATAEALKAVGAAGLLLRMLTTTPPGKKD